MFKLEIFYADGKPYWTCYFQSMEELTAWLNEEKTRPYWQKDFAVTVTDQSPPPRTPGEIEEEKKKLEAKKERKALAQSLVKKKEALSSTEFEQLLKALAIEIMGE